MRLGVSPAAASTPVGVFSQWFEALFPVTGALGCESVTHSISCCLAGPTPQSATSQRVLSARPPVSAPPTVWVSVSSLTPCLSDFHTVRFSVNSGCFLFLDCCCPSFGCARRHSVSTYVSILVGSCLYPS